MSDSSIATLSVDIWANDRVSDVLKKLDSQLDRTNAGAARAGKAIGAGIGGGAQQASSGVLTLAQAQARLLSTTGDNQGAFDTLNAAITKGTGSALQDVRAKTQLAQIQNRLSGETKSLTSLFSGLGGQLSQVGGQSGALAGSIGNLAGSIGTLGAVGAALGLAKVGLDLAVAGANAELVRTRFDGLAASANTTGDALLGALRKASGGEISDLSLQLAANRANLLGVAKSAEEMGVLMSIARDKAQQLGISSEQAFNDLIVGLGRGSVEILDNLAITVNAKAAYDTYASSIGKSANALDAAEKKQAIINATIAQGKAALDATGGAAESNAGKLAAAQASIDNFKNSVGGLLALQVGPFAAEYAKLVNALAGTGPAVEGIGAIANLGTQFNPSIQVVTSLTGAVDSAGASLARFAGIEVRDNFSPLRDSVAAWLQLLGLTPPAATAAATATVTAATAFDAYRTAATAGADASAAAIAGITALTGELGANAQAAVVAAAQQDAQSQATANLKAQTDAAVSSFLALNPSIDGAGIAAAVAAGKIPALIGQLAALRVEAYSARDAVAALAAAQGQNVKSNIGPGGVGVGAPGIASGKNNSVDAVLAVQKAEKEAADARSRQILELGTQQEQLNELEKQYAAAVKASGATSAAAIDAETRLKKERAEAAKAGTKGGGAGKGGGGAGGTTKLTDQQKLNNQLLASQESYAQKAESAEQAHLNKILKINADAAEKLKQAQDSFTQSQLEGRAGFYDSLGDIEDQGLRQALAAQYEAAFQEADAIAKEKGADVGEKFLEAKQAAIQAQAQRANEIAEATKAGDEGKAEYLAGVDKLYREAEERKLAAIKEGQGSIQSEQQAAIAEEGESYAAAQEKIGTAADQAAAKKVLAAERAGAAVDAEGLKVDALAAKYDTLAGASARAGIVPTTGGATPATPTDAPVAAAPGQTNDAIAAAINGMRSLLSSIESAVNKSGDKVASAVKSIPRSVA